MTCFGANLTVALVIAPAMCITDNDVISQILGTIFFMAGLVTLLQSTLGIRYWLSFAFLLLILLFFFVFFLSFAFFFFQCLDNRGRRGSLSRILNGGGCWEFKDRM